MIKVLVLFYSTYGHVYKMAQAVAEGVTGVEDVEATIMRVPETLPDDVLKQMGALDAQKQFADIPVANPDDLKDANAIIFGTPTRFGNMAAQMKSFLDATGGLWLSGALIGKPGGVFVSTATQHGGQESTILSFQTVLLHHGMLIAGLPYSFKGQMRTDEVTGGSPYGATTIAGIQGERNPSDNELEGARFQGARIAGIAKALKA